MSASNKGGRNKRPSTEAKKLANSPKISRRNEPTAVLVEQLSIDQPTESMEDNSNVEILGIPIKSASDKKEYRYKAVSR